ncbi:MAG: hypothetical protein IKK72_02405 [Oscillospiraceae bacterium]|nr:hypothetical protein [Oscillospiraceae bacterium]
MAKRKKNRRNENYDFNPNEILDEESEYIDVEFNFLETPPQPAQPEQFEQPEQPIQQVSDDADLDDFLSADFLSLLGMEPAEAPAEEPAPAEPVYQEPSAVEEDAPEIPEPVIIPEAEAAEEPLVLAQPMEEDMDVQEYPAAPVPAFDVEMELDEEFIKSVEEVFPAEEPEIPAPPAEPVEVGQEQQIPQQPPVRRRKKMSRERIIKEVYLPPVILGLTLILILTFIGSAIGRSIRNNREEQAAIDASNQAASDALSQEAQDLVDEALALADSYSYEEALTVLDSFSGEKSQYQSMMDAYNRINQAKDKIKPIDNPNTIPNLSFHCLIADPARAFSDKEWGKSYNTNYVTVDEFSKILDQLYANGYVLVDFNSFTEETVGEDGKVTYTTKPIYLPEDKKPIMLTETLVNYELFTIDSDGDMEADKGGDGFASKLVVRNGKIVNEYVDADGNVLYGAYDFVPILEEFIQEHPDFCYQGARATLAVSGEDGVFGYRTMHSVKEKKGEDYYNEQVEGAKAIAQALRDRGYTIASYSYANIGYDTISATKIQVDMDNWTKEIKPVLGDVPVIIFAKGSDIGLNYDNSNGKYNVLKNEGFRYFISAGNSPYTEVTVNYVRQSRIMVTGQNMTTNPQIFSSYFTVKDIMNDQRGN